MGKGKKNIQGDRKERKAFHFSFLLHFFCVMVSSICDYGRPLEDVGGGWGGKE